MTNNNLNRPYTVLVYSEEYDTEEFKYESLNDALEGLERLVLTAIKQKDDIIRWYRVCPTDET